MEKIPDHKTDQNASPVKPSQFERLKKWYRGLPGKKQYLEFITAFLTIPVLLTVLLSNVSNLQNQKKPSTTTAPTPIIEKIVVTQPAANTSLNESPTPTPTATPTPTPGPECTQLVGPIEITYPTEGSTVSDDPVCFTITRQGQNYCSVVWSYRINGGSWSGYTNNSICMYGLTPGVKTLDLRVNSIVSNDSTMLTRTFSVAGTPTPTPTVATSSGTLGN